MEPGQIIRKYGRNWPAVVSGEELKPITVEQWCFRNRWPVERGGLGAYGHFKNISKLSWPKMVWHDWARARVQAFCENHFCHFVGSAASAKTHDAGHIAMVFWLADPMNTAVILTSTTRQMVRKRAWPVIQKLYEECPGFPGNMVDSKTMLQAKKGDDKNGIFALAVADGPVSKAVANIQGIHAKRMLVIIDEATDTPEAIFQALVNLQVGCTDFNLITSGNANSHMDAHGICCEPKGGWNSIGVDDEEWETNAIPQWGIEPGICLHFDGMKSPNILLGEDKFPFLMTNKRLASMTAAPGSEQTVGFWKFIRGFWPPEGICRTVFSDALIDKYDGRGKHIFLSHKIACGALDPAFGGDRCVFYPFDLGDIGGDKLGIQLLDPIELQIKATSKEPVHYQIARQVIKQCKRLGIEKKHFGGDASGEGGGLMDIIQMEWDGDGTIHRIEFGGMPSELPVSSTDNRKCSEAYDRRVTELHFSAKEFLQAGQLKGLKRIEIVEFCSREFSDEKRKIVLDKKADCKKKIGRSPDYSDAVVCAVEIARRLGANPNNGKVFTEKKWLAKAREFSQVYEEDEPEFEVASNFFAESL